MFTVAIQSWLQQVPAGQAWLANTASALKRTSVEAEAVYWRSHKIATFQLQYQNLWHMGISDKITVVNALLWQQDVQLKSLSKTFQAWTTVIMYWAPLRDLAALQVVNRSMIRSANNSFLVPPAFSFESGLGLQDSNGQYTKQIASFRSTVGPFNSVDMYVVAVPPSLLALYNSFQTSLYSVFDAQSNVRDKVDAIPGFTLYPIPPSWAASPTTLYYGGNPMCVTGNVAYTSPQQTLSFYDNCVTPSRLSVAFTKYSSVFAALAISTGVSPSMASLCALSPSTVASQCQASLAAVFQATTLLSPVASVMLSSSLAARDVHTLNIGVMQFTSNAQATNWSLLHEPLLGDVNMGFYGWSMLYDWVDGTREVLSFQGDSGTDLVLMSVRDSPQAFPSSTPTVKTATKYLYDLVVYISGFLVLVGVLSFVAAATVKFHVHGPNLIWFNRVVGSLWIGRPLLCIRGITAVLLLSTSQLQPVLTSPSPTTRFQIHPRHWIATMIVAGEATWILYIAQDFLTLVAHKLTALYGPMSCVIAWIVLAVLELAAPVTPTATLHRTCTSQDMDSAIECASGTINIGSAQRVALIWGIQAMSLVVFYVVVWLYRGRKLAPTDLLSSSRHVLGSADIFLEDSNHGANVSATNLWSMDKMSCLMAGLVTFSWRGHQYVFNVRLWTVQVDKLSVRTSVFNTFQNHEAAMVDDVAINVYPAVITDGDDELKSLPTIVDKANATHVKLSQLAFKRLLVAGGFFYLVVAIVSSISYVQVSQQQLANDLFWGAFNMTGAHAFLANWYNQQLILGNSNVTIQINKQDINQEGMFNLAKATVTTSENFGSLMQNTDLNTIDA
ncbi:hypothetical protein As57867_017149, partial [Aphanomyces stellatus]